MQSKLVRKILTMIATLAVVLGAAGVGLAVGSSSEGSTPRSPAPVHQPTKAELKEWRAMTATPIQRAEIVRAVQEAFAGTARVGIGEMPTNKAATAAPKRSDRPFPAQLVLAYGVTGDHFWITASYGDVVRGSIPIAVKACSLRVPAWICSNAGSLLKTWSKGWGSANNHGVWAAVYWWPPHVTGGRW